MTDTTRRTAADIGLPCYIPYGEPEMVYDATPETSEPSFVYVRGTDALKLRDDLTAANARAERMLAVLRRIVADDRAALDPDDYREARAAISQADGGRGDGA